MSTPQDLHEHQLRMIADVLATETAERRVQVEAWEDGPEAYLLVVAQDSSLARAWIVRTDARTDAWTGGCADLLPAPSHHDRTAIAGAVAFRPLTSQDMTTLGLLPVASTNPTVLAHRALGFAKRPAQNFASRGSIGMSTGMGKSALVQQMVGRLHRQSARLVRPADLGYPENDDAALAPPTRQSRVLAPGTVMTPLGTIRIRDDGDPDGIRTAIERTFSDAMATLRGRFSTEASEILGTSNWTASAYAAFACPGRAGERRRQAGRLYPALANVLSQTPAAMALVDAGRPYEASLCEALSPVRSETPSIAALRRLRPLPPGTGFDALSQALSVAMRLPPDWLPADADGWAEATRAVAPLAPYAAAIGLDLAHVVAHAVGSWQTLAPTESPAKKDTALSTLQDARDMADRFRDTLVRQVALSSGKSLDDALGLRVAGAVLFGGKAVPGIHRLQERWHAGHDAFEAALPILGNGQSWPAAFPRFDAGNNIEVVCLTNEAELKAEGARGADARGANGLDHCVGGYGKRCFTGQSHIASIRRLTHYGYERLSTVEFEPIEGGPPDLDVSQHFGKGNMRPPDEAIRALSAFVEAVADSLHPLSADAFVARDDTGYGDAYDWRVPGAVERAFSAWAGYLPRDVARGGPAALAARIDAVLRDLPPPPALLPPVPPRIVVIDAANMGEVLCRMPDRNAVRLDGFAEPPPGMGAPGM